MTGHDETNLVISTIAKFEFQAPRVIARVNSPKNAWLFTIGMGVDAAINQADIIGHMVVEEMSMKSLMTLMKLSRGSYSIIQLTVSDKSSTVGKQVKDLVVFVLDKPRHQNLIAEIRKAGARIQLHSDGDVAGALMAVDPRSEVDIMMGTGGTPEGVLAACAIKGMGGQMLARLDPQSYVEKDAIVDAGIDMRAVLTVNDLVKSDDCFFAATGISGGDFLRGVRYSARHAVTHSLVLRGKTGTLRYVESYHNMDRLSKISAVNY